MAVRITKAGSGHGRSGVMRTHQAQRRGREGIGPIPLQRTEADARGTPSRDCRPKFRARCATCAPRALGRQAERSARRGRELGSRHPGRHRVRPHPDEVGNAQQDQRRAHAARSRATTATASIAARKSPRSGSARCPSRSAARIAKRRGRSPSSASVSCWRGAARRRCSSTCNNPASRFGAPPVAEPVFPPPAGSP